MTWSLVIRWRSASCEVPATEDALDLAPNKTILRNDTPAVALTDCSFGEERPGADERAGSLGSGYVVWLV